MNINYSPTKYPTTLPTQFPSKTPTKSPTKSPSTKPTCLNIFLYAKKYVFIERIYKLKHYKHKNILRVNNIQRIHQFVQHEVQYEMEVLLSQQQQ